MDYVKNIDLCRCLSLLLVVCTQKVEEFTTPVAGEYKLECWGAQGYGASGYPGFGGYAVGSINLSRLDSIFVCVGGYFNCYNNQIGTITGFYYGSVGGGATSITTSKDGELKNFKNKQNEVLLVAGGGGASEWDAHGGAGGGENGKDATTPAIIKGDYPDISKSYGKGGTQDSGGTTIPGDYEITTLYKADFGVGGIAAKDGDFGAQGGGGWYGGGGSCYAGCAGGGSSYGNTSLLISKSYQTIDGTREMPSPDGGKETGHSKHGACVISWILK